MLVLLLLNSILGVDPLGRTFELLGKFAGQEKKRGIKVRYAYTTHTTRRPIFHPPSPPPPLLLPLLPQVDSWINQYNSLHEGELDDRNSSYTTLVNAYYELATLFYEWGWGQSFHFAYQLKVACLPCPSFLPSSFHHDSLCP